VVRLLSFLLIAEAIVNGLSVATLISALPGHDTSVVIFVLVRGLVSALQFAAGWSLAERRPSGVALGQAALLAGAVLTCFDVGLNLAPTNIPYWYRWHWTGIYSAYALAAIWFLRRRSGGE
jgi:hypothetical protein